MSESRDILPEMKPDLPAEDDFLGFAPYAQTLFDIISDESTLTPLTVGIFGSWGSGKTSLMQMIKKRLKKQQSAQRRSEGEEPAPEHLTVWFNAWLYSSEESVGRALILRVLAELRRKVARKPEATHTLDEIETRLYRSMASASVGELSIGGDALTGGGYSEAEFKLPMTVGLELLQEIAQATAKAADAKIGDNEAVAKLVQVVDRMRSGLSRERVEALEAFREDFEGLVKKYVRPGFLVVFVDDLDRCLPDKAVEVLEAIKLFFDVQGCIFVLGIDREVIERGIRLKYKDYEQLKDGGPPPIDGAKYLEKIVQIPFQLPPIDRIAMEGYIGQMAPRLLELDERCDDVFAVGMEPNPRRVKRTLNIFLLLWRLSRNRKDLRERIMPVRLAKMVVIQLHHPDLFRLLPQAPHLLIDLEKRFREGQAQSYKGRKPAVGAGPVASRIRGARDGAGQMEETTGPMADFLSDTNLRELLTLHEGELNANFGDMTPAEVLEYVHLSHSAAEARAIQDGTPLTWDPLLVSVPAGEFLMGMPSDSVDELAALCAAEGLGDDRKWLLAQTPQGELKLPSFEIGKYPVTNTEYAAFVKSSEGKVSPPSHWEKGEVPPQLGSHPVVNVTWQDAMAYCDWLSERTGRTYLLPTEAQWEKAASWNAQRDEKCLYPWGDEWDAERCCNKESPEKGTTPVGQYSQAGGDSPYGVSDMAGNVWEWTLSKWGRDRTKPSFAYPYRPDDGRESREGPELRVLRGGSFYDGPGWCRSTARFPNEAALSADYIGFRVVRVAGKQEGKGEEAAQ